MSFTLRLAYSLSPFKRLLTSSCKKSNNFSTVFFRIALLVHKSMQQRCTRVMTYFTRFMSTVIIKNLPFSAQEPLTGSPKSIRIFVWCWANSFNYTGPVLPQQTLWKCMQRPVDTSNRCIWCVVVRSVICLSDVVIFVVIVFRCMITIIYFIYGKITSLFEWCVGLFDKTYVTFRNVNFSCCCTMWEFAKIKLSLMILQPMLVDCSITNTESSARLFIRS